MRQVVVVLVDSEQLVLKDLVDQGESSYTVSNWFVYCNCWWWWCWWDLVLAGQEVTSKRNKWKSGCFFPTPVSYPHPSYIRSEGGGGGGTYSPNTPHTEAEGIPGGSGGAAANCHPHGPASGGGASYVAGSSTSVPTQGYRGGNEDHNNITHTIMVQVAVVLVQQVLTRMTTQPRIIWW